MKHMEAVTYRNTTRDERHKTTTSDKNHRGRRPTTDDDDHIEHMKSRTEDSATQSSRIDKRTREIELLE